MRILRTAVVARANARSVAGEDFARRKRLEFVSALRFFTVLVIGMNIFHTATASTAGRIVFIHSFAATIPEISQEISASLFISRALFNITV
jgi:hypothetical protein